MKAKQNQKISNAQKNAPPAAPIAYPSVSIIKGTGVYHVQVTADPTKTPKATWIKRYEAGTTISCPGNIANPWHDAAGTLDPGNTPYMNTGTVFNGADHSIANQWALAVAWIVYLGDAQIYAGASVSTDLSV